MKTIIHEFSGRQIAEIQSDGIIIRTWRDIVEIISQMLSRKVDALVLHEKNLAPEFFQLKTGIAGEILQKLAISRIKVAFVGDFDSYKSKSLKAFIAESNLGDQVNFSANLQSAIGSIGSE
jgi:hypothetical protein